jgi:hypothetical protein
MQLCRTILEKKKATLEEACQFQKLLVSGEEAACGYDTKFRRKPSILCDGRSSSQRVVLVCRQGSIGDVSAARSRRLLAKNVAIISWI